jgi:hypothetical protein
MDKLTWSALEYEHREKTSDWFWALGIIVFATAATAVIYANYFFAALIILSGILLGFFAQKEPDMVEYELSEKGFQAASRFYPYENILGFWVELEGKPRLFLHLNRAVMPHLSIPIEENEKEQIRDILLNANVLEEKMQEHQAERVMEFFGF